MKKKSSVILVICLLGILLFEPTLYAGKVIDKSSEGYLLYLPNTVLSGGGSSVLVCLAGWGVKVEDDINVWKFPAEKNNFLLILPQLNHPNIRTSKDHLQVESFIFSIVDKVLEQYPVDEGRIFIAGTSAGGMMAIDLALKYPDIFSGIGVICGARLTRSNGFELGRFLKNAKEQKFYIIHGENDKIISLKEAKKTRDKLERYKAEVKFEIIEGGAHTLPSLVYNKIANWFNSLK
ncbi:MAG: prolyl oligopeptidase family serine peptidase [Candidatus Omnitrophota bacterium]